MTSPERDSNPLPIRQVVLFKHGVGAFQREGSIAGSTTIRLGFRAGELNDVLKSLTAFDLDGGRIESISYEATERLEHKLEQVHLRLQHDEALVALLRQIKGAEIEVRVGARTETGTVVGVEATAAQPDDTRRGPGRSAQALTVLDHQGSLAAFSISEITGIRLLDPELRSELEYLLATLFAGQRADRKHVTLAAHGDGTRRLQVHYVIEAPVWKTSYRVLLEDGQPPMLQGWALVDNTQDEDWNEVELSLVAGLPISFVHDLQTPRRQRRPVVAVDDSPAYAPPELESAIAASPEWDGADSEVAALDDAGFAQAAAPLGAAAPGMAKRGANRARRAAVLRETAPPPTETEAVGNLIHYRIEHPITVPRGQSALVPILQRSCGGERVLIYNQEVRDRNPMAAVWLHNDTGLTLEGGPLTVLEGAAADYVGEAMLDTLVDGERQLVPYSVELACTVAVDHRSRTTDVQTVRVHGGYLIFESFRLDVRIYRIRSRLSSARKLLLDHPIRQDSSLHETPEPIETTENFYRFAIEVAAGADFDFEVTERALTHELHELRSTPAESLRALAAGSALTDQMRALMRELAEVHAELERLRQDAGAIDQRIADVFEDQQRLRENLSALGTSESERTLRDRYVRELDDSENRLGSDRARQIELRELIQKQEQRLDARIEGTELST